MEYTTKWKFPIGTLTLASDGTSITGLWMEGQKYFQAGLSSEAQDGKELPVLQDTVKRLEQYFSGICTDFAELPLKPNGTDFQRAVWDQIRQIPYGKTVTYGRIAAALEAATGRRTSPRAVGSAVGRNPISILIPCHRVTGAGGALIGYAGGLERKQLLLELEKTTEPPK